MVILQLMIAHLLGDFVFQSNELLKEKYKHWQGTFKHAGIVTLFTILILFPFWNSAWAWITIATIALLHFVQDVLKVEYDKKYNDNNSPIPFFVDQAFHLALIIVLGAQFPLNYTIELPFIIEVIYSSQLLSGLIVAIILFSRTADITLYQFKKQKNKKLKYHPDHLGMLQRTLAFSVFYLAFFLVYRFYLGA